jgi:epsilon-lactone hydrolase
MTIHLPARDIPIPTSVSEEAQAVLASGRLGPPPREYPALDDAVGWKEYVAEADDFVRSLIGDPVVTLGFTGTVEQRDLGPCPLYVATPEGVSDDDRRVCFDIHGGAWILGGGDLCKMTAVIAANATGARTWSVDYRMPPDHPYPAALDDCLTAYRALLEESSPEEIVVGGTSAGANLAAALVLRARDEGLPLPAAVLLNTGAFDLTAAGDSWQTNDGLDNVLQGSATPAIEIYAGGHDPREPYLSPLFADLIGFPPTILLTGTRDMLLSDNVRMHRALRAAGVDAELHVWEAAGHGGFMGLAPEDADRYDELRRFAERFFGAGPS